VKDLDVATAEWEARTKAMAQWGDRVQQAKAKRVVKGKKAAK
jgi:hypothetical protein